MSMMTFLILLAMLGVVTSLALGIGAMANHGVVARRTSGQWMGLRVAFQALALVLIGVTLLT